MTPAPEAESSSHRPAAKLRDRVAVITGGDSGIGRAVAIAFAKEGAHILVGHLEAELTDARETAARVTDLGRRCILFAGDIGRPATSREMVARTIQEFGRLDIVVNNAAEQHVRKSIADISEAQLERTFRTNIFSHFYLIKAALPHLRTGASIINTTSVVAYAGNPDLMDYAATKGYRRVYTFARGQSCGQRNPGKRGGAGAHLDAAYTRHVPGGEAGDVRQECATGPGG